MNGVEDTKNLENELIAKVETGIPDQQLDAMYFAKNAALHHKLSYGYCCDLAERIINRSQNFTPENWDSLAVAVKELDFKEQAAELVGGTIAANCTLRAFNHMLVWDMFKYKNLQKQIEEKWCTEKNLLIMKSDPSYYGETAIRHVNDFLIREKMKDCELTGQQVEQSLTRAEIAYNRLHNHRPTFNPPA